MAAKLIAKLLLLVYIINLQATNPVTARSDLSVSPYTNNTSDDKIESNETIENEPKESLSSQLGANHIPVVHHAKDHRKPTHCTPTPKELGFCNKKLGWAPFSGLPNLLGHKSAELNNFISSFPIASITNIKCRSSTQLKLLLCSVLTPICVDQLTQPCRHLCLVAKNGCEPALKRNGIEWPQFLDCSVFPESKDNCIERQLNLETNSSDSHSNFNNTSESNRARKKHRKTRPTRPPWSTSQPVISHESTTPLIYSPEKYPDSDLKYNHTTATSRNLSDQQSYSTQLTTTNEGPSQSESLSTTISMSIDNQDQQPTTPITLESNPITSVSAKTPPNVLVTDQLSQALCPSSPSWLIKTKLSINQITTAKSKGVLKVRTFRQVFGSPLNRTSFDFGNRQSQRRALRLARARSILVTRSINTRMYAHQTSLYLNLTNSTELASASSGAILTQPLIDVLNKSSLGERSEFHYYLVAGSESINGTRTVNLFIRWPSLRKKPVFPEDRGALNIVKTYRELKRRGAKFCEDQSVPMTKIEAIPNLELTPNSTLTGLEVRTIGEATESTIMTTSISPVDYTTQPTRRKQKRKKNNQQSTTLGPLE